MLVLKGIDFTTGHLFIVSRLKQMAVRQGADPVGSPGGPVPRRNLPAFAFGRPVERLEPDGKVDSSKQPPSGEGVKNRVGIPFGW